MLKTVDDLFSQYLNHKLAKIINRRKLRLKDKCVFAIPSHDFISTEICVSGWYEYDILDAVVEVLSKNNLLDGTFIDVGANIGNHAIFMSYYFDQVIAFEPLFKNYRYLKFNSELRPNVRPLQIGLGRSESIIEFKYCPDNAGKSGQFVGDASWEIEKVKVQSFDQLGIDVQPTVVKVDVEGAELSVLEGMVDYLSKYHPLLMIETDFHAQSELVYFLHQNNYRYFYALDTPFRSERGIFRKFVKAMRSGERKWRQIDLDHKTSFCELALVSSEKLIL